MRKWRCNAVSNAHARPAPLTSLTPPFPPTEGCRHLPPRDNPLEERLSISSLLGSTPCAFIAGAVQEEAPLVHHGRARHCVRGRRRRRACTTAVLDIPSIRRRRACTKRPSASRITRRYEVDYGEPRSDSHEGYNGSHLRTQTNISSDTGVMETKKV